MNPLKSFRSPEPESGYQQAPAPENALFRFDIRRSLRRYRPLATTVAILVFIIGLVAAIRMHPMYWAESVVYISPTSPKILTEGQQNAWPFDQFTYDSYIQQQVRNISRYDILARAIQQPGVNWRGRKESEQSAVDRLSSALHVHREAKSYQIDIGLQASNPELAAATVNAITQVYLKTTRDEDLAGNNQRLAALRAERTQLQNTLDSRLAEQVRVNRLLGVSAISGNPNPYDETLTQLRNQVADAQVKHDEVAAKLHSLQDGPSGSSALTAAASEAASSDQGLNSFKESLNRRRSELIAQMAGLTPDHPLYKQDQEELKQINDSLQNQTAQVTATEKAQIEEKLRADLVQSTAVLAKLESELADKTRTATSATPALQRSSELTQDIQRMQLRYATVDDRIRNLELENNSPGNVRLSSSALPPLTPMPGKRRLVLLMLLPLSLALGVAAAVIAARADRFIYSASDVEAALGFRPLAVLLDRGELDRRVAEEYVLRLAAGIQSAHRNSNAASVLITGLAPNSGASTVAQQLAASLTKLGQDSALLDLEQTPRTVTQRDLADLAAMHSLVLLDAPPLLSSAQTEYLARSADIVLVVAEAGSTTRNELHRAARLLANLQASGVAVILNKTRIAFADDELQRDIASLKERIADRSAIHAGRSANHASRPALRLFPANHQPLTSSRDLADEVVIHNTQPGQFIEK